MNMPWSDPGKVNLYPSSSGSGRMHANSSPGRDCVRSGPWFSTGDISICIDRTSIIRVGTGLLAHTKHGENGDGSCRLNWREEVGVTGHTLHTECYILVEGGGGSDWAQSRFMRSVTFQWREEVGVTGHSHASYGVSHPSTGRRRRWE
ncbi:hypothetical protein ElyMa_003832900 [Elysia marginata]|uniref:Uncharacterized protein n=1 Tax=Elysia marginata TaxID=1093978 RepID=A0AAV4FHL6_9GAST|nr:hypothetical protein ElyMa_003832900 [Elysia marginata]